MLLLSALVRITNGQTSNITAVWANDGGDKVSRDELRVTHHVENQTGLTRNRTWDGTAINLYAAHNEVVSFNLILEAGGAQDAQNVSVTFDTLTGPGGAVIHSDPTKGNGVFNWVDRPIEMFYARYLQIQGLSFFGYNKWDERQVPLRFARPRNDQGTAGAGTGWYNRPDHDKYYPDPLVPLELVGTFTVKAGSNQSVWSDVYVPKTSPAGTYHGLVSISENGVTRQVPVNLSVWNFTLPDKPAAKTMAAFSSSDILYRYVTAGAYQNSQSPEGLHAVSITDNMFKLFHRHKISLIGENDCPIADHPCDSSVPRLSGSLFTALNGYDGPGVNVGNDVFSIGTYGTWGWQFGTEQDMWNHVDAWTSWFASNLPKTDFFLYLQDEPGDPQHYQQVQQWAQWMKEDPGPGSAMQSLVTKTPVIAQSVMPSVTIPVLSADLGACQIGIVTCNNTANGDTAAAAYSIAPHKLWAYNDGRPATGSAMTEDDGTAMRVLGWSQMKKGIDRWFYWYVNPDGQQNLFQTAVTWGTQQFRDGSLGLTGNDQTSNGNGLLVYPGTDKFNPGDSYNVDGPIASLRLKEWRRGIQDADYIALASKIDPVATNNIVDNVLPKTLWEYYAVDPTYYTASGPSWSSDPDTWERARVQMASIISRACVVGSQNLAVLSQCAAAGSVAQAATSGSTVQVSGTEPSARVYVFGMGCPVGFYDLPFTYSVQPGTLCGMAISAPNGFSFASWSDGSTDNVRRDVINGPLNLVATLTAGDAPQAALSVTASLPNASVTISGVSCPQVTIATPATIPVNVGAQCTVTANPSADSQFDHWSTGSTQPALTVVVPATGLTLNFTLDSTVSVPPPPPPVLTTVQVIANTTGASVFIFGSGCPMGLQAVPVTLSIQPGTLCSLTPIAPSGTAFSTWADGSTQAQRGVVATSQLTTYEMDFSQQ